MLGASARLSRFLIPVETGTPPCIGGLLHRDSPPRENKELAYFFSGSGYSSP